MNTNIVEWRIQMMAKCGGFSYAAIAKEVLGGKYSKEDKQYIYRILKKNNIKLRDWRQLESKEAKAYYRSSKKVKSKQKTA